MHEAHVVLTLAAGTHNIPLLTTIAAAFAAAWVLGLITQRIGLSPIVGYLLAGIVIGRHTPGFAGDTNLALQLAEVGVILLMFGVGLHFHLKDLLAVKGVAIPGAVGQSLVATVATVLIFHALGWPLRSSVVLGMAMAVASTVVLLRVLMDKGMLSSSHGHVAVGWLIVEDILTVLALVMVPIFGTPVTTDPAAVPIAPTGTLAALATVGWALLKLGALVAIVLLAGSKVVPWILTRVARLRSQELFTLTVMVLSISIAVGSATIFGASVALGAFLAGMVVAQSPVSHQAAADALPMRDAFAVIFFVSVGMLFDPGFVVEQPWMVGAALAIVLVGKPLAALVIVALCGRPLRTGLTVAIGLAQIGEFSFILAQVAGDYQLMHKDGMNILVATAIASITLNPILFGSLDRIERAVQRWPWLYRLLNARHDRRAMELNRQSSGPADADLRPLAIIVGYGPVGRLVDAMLRDAAIRTMVIDMNIDTVQSIVKSGHAAMYGDATRPEVLDQAGIAGASYLVVSLPHAEGRATLVRSAKERNAGVQIIVRARYLAERDVLYEAGAAHVVFEEGEAGVALARHVLAARGVGAEKVDRLLGAVRRLWKMDAQ